MFYKLIGYLVWRGLRFALRRRYGNRPKTLAAGVVVGAALAAAAAAAARAQSDD